MTKDNKYFVRIDKKANDTKCSTTDYDDHVEYLKNIAKQQTFYGGGFEHTNGGMIIFTADSLKDAKDICDNDPIISRGFYKYDIYEWNILISSEDSKKI